MAEQDDLTLELARQGLAAVSPEEIPLLDALGPELLASADEPNRGDGALGFGGIEIVLASVVVAVAKAVVEVITDVAKKYAAEEGTGLIHRLVEFFRSRHDDAKDTPKPVLDPDELARAREVAHQRAVDLGVDEPKASVLADAIVGALALGG
jgi:hypothetical protein